jgi:cytochrome b561
MNDVKRYTGVAIFFHWSIAFLILALLAAGWTFEALGPSPFRTLLINLHKLFGCVTLLLVVGRYTWRAFNRPPASLPSIATWQKRLASLVHLMLYVAMLVAPLSGVVFVNYRNGVSFFGIHLPQILPTLFDGTGIDPETVFQQIHVTVPYVMGALLVLHIGAALWHHGVKRDATLKRMLPAG